MHSLLEVAKLVHRTVVVGIFILLFGSILMVSIDGMHFGCNLGEISGSGGNFEYFMTAF